MWISFYPLDKKSERERSIAPKKRNCATAALNLLPQSHLTRRASRYARITTVTVGVKMNLWGKLREGGSETTAVDPTTLAAKPVAELTACKDRSSQNETILDPQRQPATSKLLVHQVSEAEYCQLGNDDWIPAVMRGLEVVWPRPDWEITGSMIEQLRTNREKATARRAPTVAQCSPNCPVCQCPLFWEPIGDPTGRLCVECRPPSSPRVAEDLWLVGVNGWFECVSNEPRWQRAAFEVYERGRARTASAAASRVEAGNAGF